MQDRKEKQKDIFVNACIKGANDLRKIVNVDEEIYYTHPGYSGNSKNYYIYLVLNELEKAGTALIRIHEFISSSRVSDEKSCYAVCNNKECKRRFSKAKYERLKKENF